MNTTMSPLAVALLAAFAAQVHAEDGVPLHQLGTVTITGNRPTSLPTQIPTTIEGITKEDIERDINATDAEDALKYLPSLLVRKRYIGDYNHAVLSTRASGTGNSARSMVYADGILLSNYLGNGATFAPRWGMVSPEEIERVDVLYGPFSAAYGGNSVGAVVDYVTRMPTRFEAHAKLTLTHQPFKLYGTNDRYDGKQGSFSLGDRQGAWSWWLALNRTDSEGQPLTFPTRAAGASSLSSAGTPVSGAVAGLDRTNSPWYLLGAATQYHTVQDQLKAKLAVDFSPTMRATYTFGLWRNASEGRPTSYLRDAAGQPVYSGTVNVSGHAYTLTPTDFNVSNEDLRHVMHGLTLKTNTRGVFDWEIAASLYDYDKDRLRAATTVTMPASLNGGAGRLVNQGGTGWNTLAAKGVWRPDAAHIAEFGYQREAYKLSSTESPVADWISGTPVSAPTSRFAGKTEINSLYAQDTWKFAPQWKTVLGARFEHWHAHDGVTANALNAAAHAERTEHYVSPKAALAYQASEDWVLKASLGRAVRMPTVSELYQGGLNAAGQLTNNDPKLKPEKSWTTELSGERKLDGGYLRLTAFGERTADALYSQTNVLVLPLVTNIQNVDLIRTKGLEVSYGASDVLLRGLELSSSLTWTDSKIIRNDKAPSSVGKWQPRIPAWRATGVATYAVNDKLSMTLAARYSGKQYSTLDNSDVNGFAYQGASKYFTADARLRYRFNAQWSMALGVDNLNNYQYWNFHPYPQRTYVAELKFDL